MKGFYAKNALVFLLPAYLFAGIYKNTIPLPWGDWTALLALLIAVTCLILYQSCLPLIREPRFWLLGFLICYLGIRSWPMTEWGTYKLAEVVVLGGPALCAGYLLANDMQRFGRVIAGIAVIVALYATIKACTTDTVWTTTEVLSGGYQLTSGLLAYGLMAIVLDQAIPNLLRFLRFQLLALDWLS